MTDESYLVEYKGYTFRYGADPDAIVTTTLPPTLRVIEGSWPTWRLDPGTAPDYKVRLRKSVNAGDPNAPHPAGNLTAPESTTNGWVLRINNLGYLERSTIGSVIYHRLLNQAG